MPPSAATICPVNKEGRTDPSTIYRSQFISKLGESYQLSETNLFHIEVEATWLPFYRRHIQFSWMIIFIFWFKFHWSLFPWIQLMIRGSGSSLAANKQCVIWKDGQVYICICHTTSMSYGKTTYLLDRYNQHLIQIILRYETNSLNHNV